MIRDSRLAVIVAVAVTIWLPLTHLDWFRSHEEATYLIRTIEWAEELRSGHLYPRWAPDLYGGYGSPLFVFYAPGLYAVTGLLTAIGVNVLVALKLVVLASSVLAGLGTYWLIFGQTGQRDASLLGSLAYLAAPYRIGDFYARGDLSEYTCLAVLPIVLALYLAAAREVRPSRARALAFAAALAHSVMIVTHTIIGLWASVLVGLVILVRSLELARRGTWRRALPLTVALGCAPGLAGAYIVPALAYRSFTHANVMIVRFFRPQNQWIRWTTLFDENSQLMGRNFMRIGPFLVAALVVTAVAVIVNVKKARPALAWSLLSLTCVGLTLPIGSGFWAPGRVPLSQFIQFPWRLLGPTVLFACVALGVAMAVATARLSEQLKGTLAIAGGAAFLMFLAWPFVSAPEMPQAMIIRDSEAIRLSMTSATAADEFLPLAVASPPSEPRGELIHDTQDATVKFSSSDGSRHALALIAAKPGAVVRLAVYGFPGWTVDTVSGPAEATLDTESHGLLQVRLPRAGSYRLAVSYGSPPAARWGVAVSVLSLFALSLLLLRGSVWWPARLPTPRFDSPDAAVESVVQASVAAERGAT